MSHDEHVQPYNNPAGGWGALINTGKQVVKNKGIARAVKSLLQVNQPEGFDCPGCAWPEPKNPSTFEFCENGAKAVSFEATAKRVTPEFFAHHPVKQLRAQTDFWLENQGRLTHPMRYDSATDTYKPLDWPAAFKLIGDRLRALASPSEAIFYTSGRTSNEAAFLYQLFGREFGTNNFPDCSNMCHESSGCALTESIGIGKGTVSLEDFEHADAIFVIGQNPGTNHPRMLTELQNAAKRGAKIVSINPLRERGLVAFTHPQQALAMISGGSTAISTHYYQVLIGGDLAALKGIMKYVLDAEDAAPGTILDHAFIKEHTSNFDAFVADIKAADWNDITAQSGLSREQLAEAAKVYLDAKKVIICWAMGLTQHKHAVPTIQYIVNLLLLRGNLGRPGAGACPVRGHSNVQGDRTMGITEHPRPAFLKSLGETFNFTPPTASGYDVVAAINAMAKGEAKVFIGMGGNFAAATPDSRFTESALEKCSLTVHISTKLNRSHTIVGRDALILPCLGRTETDIQKSGPQFVTVEDSMSMVHRSQGRNTPASSQLLSEPAIVSGIARAALPGTQTPWEALVEDYGRIREKIAAVVPGFTDFVNRVKTPGGFYLGNSARERNWKTQSGKAQFTVAAIPDLTLPPGQLRMMTIRSHDQYNTTIYDNDDRYRGIFGLRRVVLMNKDDIAARQLSDGEYVDITSHTREDGSTRVAKSFRIVAYDIPAGCAATYFPEANALISKDSFADKSRTPLSKFVPITLARSTEPAPPEGRR
jgi:molybdopterin-dependent oxidoreductase alpha subunit